MQGNDSFKKYIIFNEETNEFENQEHYRDSHESEITMFYGEEFSDNLDKVILVAPDEMDEVEKELYKSITKILSKSKSAGSYASKHNLIDNKTDKIMVYPNDYAGLSIITTKDESSEKDMIYAVFPFFSEGREYKCKIKSLFFDDNEKDSKEGQIEAFIDEEENLLLTFYDMHFIDNQSLYNPDDTFVFSIMGLAKNIEKIDNDDMISLTPDYDLPSEEYTAETIVKEIKLLDKEINGEKVWKLTVVIGYTPDGEDIPLDVYATSRSFEDSAIPQVDDNIRVSISIHGYLKDIEK